MLCMRKAHKVCTVNNMIALGRVLDTEVPRAHKVRKNCVCATYKKQRCRGCRNPHKYSKKAQEYIARLKEMHQR